MSKQTNVDRIRAVLQEIQRDMERDASSFDGRPFNGKTVAEYFGNQGAAVAALARILDDVVQEVQEHAESHDLEVSRLRSLIVPLER